MLIITLTAARWVYVCLCVCVCVCLCYVCLCVFIEKIDGFSIVKNYHLNVSLGATKRNFFSRILRLL